nr:hypothetical protein HmN_000990000 [Hymenolepis microstoma]
MLVSQDDLPALRWITLVKHKIFCTIALISGIEIGAQIVKNCGAYPPKRSLSSSLRYCKLKALELIPCDLAVQHSGTAKQMFTNEANTILSF